MKLDKNRILYWTPRLLSLLFVGFLSLFALDAFTGNFQWVMLLGFLIHLIPSFVLLAFIMVAWRYDLFGAIVFFIASLWYVWMVGLNRHWSWYAGICGPALLVSFLFFLNWLRREKI